jgi:putative transposase
MSEHDFPRRRTIRLKNFDYARQGAYFITICIFNRYCLFGEIISGGMHLDSIGMIARECLLGIPAHLENANVFEFIIMPNHIHSIIILENRYNETGMACHAPTDSKRFVEFGKPVKGTMPTLVGAFKSAVTKKVNLVIKDSNNRIWQRGFHDHIIRNENEPRVKIEYIKSNPQNWDKDPEYVAKL